MRTVPSEPTSARMPRSAPTSACSDASSATSSATRLATRSSTSSRPCGGAPSTLARAQPAGVAGRGLAATADRGAAAPDPGVRLVVAARQHGRGRPPRAASPLPPQHGSQPQLGSLTAAFDHLERAGLDAGGGRASDRRPRRHPGDHRPSHRGAPPDRPRRLAEVARLLADRTGLADDDPDLADIERRFELAVLTLWQTAEVRLSKLRVVDEINEALRYYRQPVRCRPGDRAPVERLAAGWGIGVDASRVVRWGRGSAATVTATPSSPPRCCAPPSPASVPPRAPPRLPRRARQALSMSDRLVTRPPELVALAAQSGDASPFRADEPYRQALRGMYGRGSPEPSDPRRTEPSTRAAARRPATRLRVDGRVARRPRRRGRVAAFPRRGALADSLVEPVRRAGRHVRRAPLRARPPPERIGPRARRRRAAGGRRRLPSYVELDEADRVALLSAELASPRPLRSPFAPYSEEAGRRARRAGRGRRRRRPLRRGDDPALRRVGPTRRATCWRRCCCCEEVGLVRPRRAPVGARHRPAVRDDRRPRPCAGGARRAARPADVPPPSWRGGRSRR